MLSPVLGVDLTGLAGTGTGSGQGSDAPVSECATGQAANASVDCLMAGAADSLDTNWSTELPALSVTYTPTRVVLFSDQTSTGCGDATSAVAPFYCPPDQIVYPDTAFYDDLRTQDGASGGPLAEMYVVAHEWDHHIQNISGISNGLDLQATRPTSDSVRLELQADFFAGAWVGAASTIKDSRGVTFLKPVS